MTASHVKTEDMFRSADLYDKLKGANLVLFVIYDQQGAVVEAMTFKGTGNEKSWFGFDNLVSNVNWKIYGGEASFQLSTSVFGRHFEKIYLGSLNNM